MIPLHDNIPSRHPPIVNYALIGVTALVFVAQLREREEDASLVEKYGMIPARVKDSSQPVMIPDIQERYVDEPVLTPEGPAVARYRVREVFQRPAAEPGVPAIFTLLTCIFLHGGWLHFLGNMWFLHIFGDNVEDRFGHIGYLIFYLACGVAASAVHYFSDPGSPIPTVGASGAIAGIMGGYLVSYPHARVLTLIPIVYFLHIAVIPAVWFLGIWFAMQFFQGVATVGDVAAGGVAWWAHIGGFVVGAAAVWILGTGRVLRDINHNTRPDTDHTTWFRVGSRGSSYRRA